VKQVVASVALLIATQCFPISALSQSDRVIQLCNDTPKSSLTIYSYVESGAGTLTVTQTTQLTPSSGVNCRDGKIQTSYILIFVDARGKGSGGKVFHFRGGIPIGPGGLARISLRLDCPEGKGTKPAEVGFLGRLNAVTACAVLVPS
jgi:hypothetical protein